MLGILEKIVYGLTALALIVLVGGLVMYGLPSTTPSIAMESRIIDQNALDAKLNADQKNRLDVAIRGLDESDDGKLVPREDGNRAAKRTLYEVDEDLFDRLGNLNDCISELSFASSKVQEDGTLKVFDIQEGSLLQKVGLADNDILERVDGLKIDFGNVSGCRDSWQKCLQRLEVGDPIVVEIRRNGARHHLIVSPSF